MRPQLLCFHVNTKALINRRLQIFASLVKIAILPVMEGDQDKAAIARIEAALARIDAASSKLSLESQASAPPNVMNLVNKHEALKEEVVETLRDLDKLIAELEE